ncbi:hypothetical protein BU26DRAFT_321222 [Trematosphaeria pertusa]|uniref:Secreted protein n=1 Tax=Trematosphaeria pertusa TaxID=390896 RepID=A0A6A6ICL9_9PLEO|nr:uncharacterized protein BU26DRAFT_321222 [Trematosphaeria pertusa]KAF2247808.1 hypothetical protein BU26DRAFT_321222 [Trematosphaeria pertusa]
MLDSLLFLFRFRGSAVSWFVFTSGNLDFRDLQHPEVSKTYVCTVTHMCWASLLRILPTPIALSDPVALNNLPVAFRSRLRCCGFACAHHNFAIPYALQNGYLSVAHSIS